ncbi:MAG TPA: response regulator [Polyangiaceae bacterium]|nr:response regulator [Polyangiaceae bacterium]
MGRVQSIMSNTPESEHGPAACAALFASNVVGVVIWKGEGIIVESNGALRALLGWSADGGLPGQSLDAFISPEQRARFSASRREIAQSRGCRVFELFCVRKDGRRIRTLVAVVSLAPSSEGGFCLFFDADTEMAGAGRELSDRMVSLGQLAAGIAHEINNPLAYAMGNLSFAIEHLQGLSETTPELLAVLAALRDALEGAERVRRTVRDLKMFARPESDRQGPVDVERALRAAISMASMEIRHRARLALDFDVVPPAQSNESQLAHVLLNLLLNATHALGETDAQKNEIRVTMRHLPSDRILVEIQCSGQATVPSVETLDPFPMSRLRESAGLGLALSHRLIHDSGGELLVENTGDQGPTFKILLLPAGEGVESAVTSPARRAARQRARVLVVDDEPRIGSAIARILDPAHEVTAVYTARDAIRRLERGEQYDVILCDILMPQMSGYDLYRSLEQIAPQFVNRIIFMTGGPFSTRGAGFLDSVPNARLEKPFSPEALRTLVQRSLQ